MENLLLYFKDILHNGWFYVSLLELIVIIILLSRVMTVIQKKRNIKREILSSDKIDYDNKNSKFLMLAFFMSYIGLLLMSQLNPGEFCPMPYELLVVCLFVFLELTEDGEVPARSLDQAYFSL